VRLSARVTDRLLPSRFSPQQENHHVSSVSSSIFSYRDNDYLYKRAGGQITAAEAFTGEDTRISSRLQTQQMVVMTNAPAGESPRAVATLAIARSVLEKSKDTLVAGSN